MENSKKMLKTAGFMAIATFLAKALGLARDMLIAAFFGTGIEADAYMTATRLPTTLFDIVIGGVISAAFIPVFNSVLEKKDKEKALEFANRFIGMVLLISGLIAILGIVFADNLITFMAPDFDSVTHYNMGTLAERNKDYLEVVDVHKKDYDEMDRRGIKYFPEVH